MPQLSGIVTAAVSNGLNLKVEICQSVCVYYAMEVVCGCSCGLVGVINRTPFTDKAATQSRPNSPLPLLYA